MGDDITSKILAFAFGLSAEKERNLISQRTKEALIKRRADGVTLRRPKGKKSSHYKLSGKEEVIHSYLMKNLSITDIAKILNVNRNTLSKFIRDNNLCFNMDN